MARTVGLYTASLSRPPGVRASTRPSRSNETPSVEVTAEGIVNRIVALPGIEAGNYGALSANEGSIFYLEFPDNGSPSLMRYDLEAEEEFAEKAGGGDPPPCPAAARLVLRASTSAARPSCIGQPRVPRRPGAYGRAIKPDLRTCVDIQRCRVSATFPRSRSRVG